MKFRVYLWLIFLVIVSCKFTNPNNTNVNEAMLLVENYTTETLYLTVEDGSLGQYPVHILESNGTYSQTWESDDAVFELQDGQVLLSYHSGDEEYETAYLQLTPGYTSYYTISDENSVLVITNETNSEAWFSIGNGNLNYLFPDESSSVSFGDLGAPETIDLFYTGYHVFSQNIGLTIYPYQFEEFYINADAGAIKLKNHSLSNLTEVYIAPSEDQYWGENRLYSILEPEEIAWWTVEPGWWDVRIVDEWGFFIDFLDFYIALDETDDLTYRQNSADNEPIPLSEKVHSSNLEKNIIDKKIEFKKILSD